MIDSWIIDLVGFLAIVGLLVGVRIFESCRERRSLRLLIKAGREIEAADAIENCKHGLGLLIRNHGPELPGRWWYLVISEYGRGRFLDEDVARCGFVVLCKTRSDRAALMSYDGEIDHVGGTFDQLCK